MSDAGYARLPAVIRDGRVVLANGVQLQLPDGTQVEVVVKPLEFTPEEQAEFDAWERLSDEAWAMIDWGEQGLLHTCPCCGYYGLSVQAYANLPPPPWGDLGPPPYEQSYGLPSYDVCPCCGFEFGNDDNPGTAVGSSFAAYLRDWIAEGCQWFDPTQRAAGWLLDSQLSSAGIPNPTGQK